MKDRFRRAVEPHQIVAEIVFRLGEVGLEHERGLEMRNRLRHAPRGGQGDGEVVVRHPAGGIAGQGRLVEREDVAIDAGL